MASTPKTKRQSRKAKVAAVAAEPVAETGASVAPPQKLYIRVRKDGFIYDYNERMAKNPACEVITEEQAYPERFIPAAAKGRVVKLDLTTDVPEQPATDIVDDISAELTRRTTV